VEIRKMTCINCPLGCSIEVAILGEDINVTGNKCKRGQDYGVNEVRDPRRVVTSTIKVIGGEKPLTAVKTDSEIPKKVIFEVMEEINKISVVAPIMIGDVLIENVLGTGANIVASSRVNRSVD
jgi:CxxC motif-containing protein